MIVTLFSFSIQGQKRAFEIEDIYKLKYVGSPTISHNGKLVAFTVTEYNLKEAKSNTEIFVMNVDGSK
jgi:dipeptidyl aminopeptidase/acylaminoacyl peptidase